MAVISTLAVSLTARTKKFRKGMKNARRSVGRFASGVAKAGRRVAKFGARLTAVAAGAFVLLTKRSGKTIDALAKVSSKLGIATEKLVGLRLAAERTGVNANTLDMALQRMTRRIAEAAQDTGEAKDALIELKLSAVALAALSPDKQFAAIADAMEQVGTQGERVRLGFKLFDSEGVALINTLRGGSEQLEAYQKRAEELGITLTDIDVAKVEAANDALGDMGKVLTGLFNTITVRLAPIIEHLAKKFTDWAVNSKLATRVVEWGANAAKSALTRLTVVVNSLVVAWHGLRVAGLFAITKLLQGIEGLGRALAHIVNFFAKELNAVLQKIPAKAAHFLPPLLRALHTTQALKHVRFEVNEELVHMRKGMEMELANAQKAFAKAFSELWNVPDTARRDWFKFFADLTAAANAAAATVVSKLQPLTPASAGIEGGSRGLRAIDLSLEGLRDNKHKPQVVVSPQLANLNRLVAQVVANTRGKGGLAP